MVSKILALKKVYSNLSEHDQGFELAKQDWSLDVQDAPEH